jgi:hypothetical protein
MTGNMHLVGRARDVVTPHAGGAPIVCAEDGFDARVKPDRTIESIRSQPPRIDLSCLVGVRGGGKLRGALEQLIPQERRHSTPLYLILDDISGASLVAGWAWSQWDPNWLNARRSGVPTEELARLIQERVGVCTGFAPGSSSLDPSRLNSTTTSGTPTTDLRHPDDGQGWHVFTSQNTVGMRRARRVDVWMEGAVVMIDSAFQDSASTPNGTRAALHEYQLHATADPQSMRLLSLDAVPHVLPFSECPGAVANISRLVGGEISGLRQAVLDELPGTLGCTHLNDALRALAEVPALVRHLQQTLQAA